MAITRVCSTWVIGGAAILAIALFCIGKLASAIQAVPLPMMGGVSLLLYSIIAASSIRVLIELKGMALATMVGITLSLIFRVITLLRSEEKIHEPDEGTPPDGRAAPSSRRGKVMVN